MSVAIRPAAVAGTFYPDRREALLAQVAADLGPLPSVGRRPLALIVPHAGLIYSGGVAASAYRTLAPHASAIRRVALFGPCHRAPLAGMAVPRVDRFETPLGEISLDRDALGALAGLDAVRVSDPHHALEHSLEVQLPYLQTVLERFLLVPVVVGPCPPASVAEAMTLLLDDETVLVVSSDLSHFHAYDEARSLDRDTARRIVQQRQDLNGEQACGCHAVNGLLRLAEARHWQVEQLQLCNSGDTAGPRDRVVGYGAFALHDPD